MSLATDPFPETTAVCQFLQSTSVDYLRLVDELSGFQYLRIVTTGGLTEFVLQSTLPSGTGYIAPVILKGFAGQRWQLGALSYGEITITPAAQS